MLKPKKKITRKEIKKDPVLEKIAQAEHFIHEQGKMVMYVVIAVAVIIALSITMIRSKQNANRVASGELGIAETAIASGDHDNAIFQLEALIDKNPGTKSAGMATLLLAQTYITKDDYENAEINFQKYIDDYHQDDMLMAAAYNGLGACDERKENFEQAAKYFEKGGNKSPYKFLKYECYVNAVRNYIKLHEIEKAERLLKMMPEDDLDYKYKSQVDMLNAEIKVLKG